MGSARCIWRKILSNHVLICEKLLKSCEQAICKKFSAVRLYKQKDQAGFLRANGAKFNAIAGHQVDKSLMDSLPNLKMIANFGVGYDGIDIEAAKKRGIHVTNTPDVLNDAMAEMTIGLMICLSRKILLADKFVREQKWGKGNFPLQNQLAGKVAAIVGLGRIGKEIAIRCEAMKMQVIYFGRNCQSQQPYEYFSGLLEMSQKADWLIVTTPGGGETAQLIDEKVLSALGATGYLVNVARGSVVDETALIEKLVAGEIAGAALDVFADEPNVPSVLFNLDNVILSPHQGSATNETRDAMGALVVANLEAFFAQQPLLTPIF